MKGINIRLPEWLVRWGEAFVEWGDVLVWKLGPLNIRRIDFLIGLSGVLCVLYYLVNGGWLLALQGFAVWVFVVLVVLWFF